MDNDSLIKIKFKKNLNKIYFWDPFKFYKVKNIKGKMNPLIPQNAVVHVSERTLYKLLINELYKKTHV